MQLLKEASILTPTDEMSVTIYNNFVLSRVTVPVIKALVF
jgi:hypothetical protein